MSNLYEVPGMNEVKYAVKVNGMIVSPPVSSPQQASEKIKLLSEAHQMIAEVVRVTADGKEILFG